MDNNFISIDDLVRQRLSGGEERERAGAWSRMRELLDEEEDRKPVGFFWRRMFGGLAILVLIGALSLGGYELMASAGTAGGGGVTASTAPNNNPEGGGIGHGGSPSHASVISGINKQRHAETTAAATNNTSSASTAANTTTTSSSTNSNQPTNNNTTTNNTPDNATVVAHKMHHSGKLNLDAANNMAATPAPITATVATVPASTVGNALASTSDNNAQPTTASHKHSTKTASMHSLPLAGNAMNVAPSGTLPTTAAPASGNGAGNPTPSGNSNTNGNAANTSAAGIASNNAAIASNAPHQAGKKHAAHKATATGSTSGSSVANNSDVAAVNTNNTLMPASPAPSGAPLLAGTSTSHKASHHAAHKTTQTSTGANGSSQSTVVNNVGASAPVGEGEVTGKRLHKVATHNVALASNKDVVTSGISNETASVSTTKTAHHRSAAKAVGETNKADTKNDAASVATTKTAHHRSTAKAVGEINATDETKTTANASGIAANNSTDKPIVTAKKHVASGANATTAHKSSAKTTNGNDAGEKVAQSGSRAHHSAQPLALAGAAHMPVGADHINAQEQSRTSAHHPAAKKSSSIATLPISGHSSATAGAKAVAGIGEPAVAHKTTGAKSIAHTGKTNAAHKATGTTGTNATGAKSVAGTRSGAAHKVTGTTTSAKTAGKLVSSIPVGSSGASTSVAKKAIAASKASTQPGTTGAVAMNTPKTPAKAARSGNGGGSGSTTTTTPTGNNSGSGTVIGTRTIQQVTVSERLVKVAPATFLTHFDTMSIESITVPILGSSEDDNSNAAPLAANAGADASNATNSGNTAITPDASKSDASGSNAAENMKKKSGAHGLTGLEEAFNDIKYKVGNARFAMGLTGGINGTFFGPNSFKGFQFGVTGNFIFSESVNIMMEVKYFQRANNDFTLNDNYYNYTPNAGGGYTRQEVVNPYSFSSLHSFEMPLAIRYSVGKFNFFAGGNLVYAMAINEAHGLPTVMQTTSPAMSIGNDNAPKIAANDFNSRFGVGYLAGVSVQLSQSMSLDLRDVQTIWDNAGTAGAKEVSTALYRSPSFQISLGYRFGSKKGKDKE